MATPMAGERKEENSNAVRDDIDDVSVRTVLYCSHIYAQLECQLGKGSSSRYSAWSGPCVRILLEPWRSLNERPFLRIHLL